MKTKEKIIAILRQIVVPGAGRSLIDINILRYVWIDDQKAEIKLASTALNGGQQEWLQKEIEKRVSGLAGIESVQVSYEAVAVPELNKIGRVVAVTAGKGTPGKALVSGLTALALRNPGYSVGILDAGSGGQAIQKLFGLQSGPPETENGYLPLISKSGIAIASLNYFIPAEKEAPPGVGFLTEKLFTRVWESVLWGNLDILLLDLPPGLAQNTFRILRQLPLCGMLVVTSPQYPAAAELKNALKLAGQMDHPAIGVVEVVNNLAAGEENPKTGKPGYSKMEETARASGVTYLGQLSLEPDSVGPDDTLALQDRFRKEIEPLAGFVARLPAGRQPFRPDCQHCDHICDGNCKG